jgi:hypothetical protein
MRSPLKVNSTQDLRNLQRAMGEAIMRPLTKNSKMQSKWVDGRPTSKVINTFIKPNDRLSSFERLEIYNRQYWFRILDCFYDDFPGLRAVIGEKKFSVLAEEYISRLPSRSFTLRNLGSRLEKFLRKEPKWIGPNIDLALDMIRLEWARITAFDEEALPPITTKELLGTNPAKLKLNLQPYLSLLELDYPVDDFLIAINKKDSSHEEVSNAVNDRKRAHLKRTSLPKKKKVYRANHRVNNSLFYKELEPEAFKILFLLKKGAPVQQACTKALAISDLRNQDLPLLIKRWFTTWTALGWFCKTN